MFQKITKTPEETMAVAAQLARLLKRGAILCLQGDLGAGKTTFVKGLAKGLRLKVTNVHSPTFTLLNIYQMAGRRELYHFDLYRLATAEDIESLGYEEFFYGSGISVIEWSERLGILTPKEYLKVELQHVSETERKITLTPYGKVFQVMVGEMKKKKL